MAHQHRMQENRFELKYIIEEARARGVRDFARSYLVPDPHADPEKNYSYPIHSIYLDSPGFSLCNATIQGHKNRFKLRCRYYDDNSAGPIFFEIKRRVNDVILKRRAAVRRDTYLSLLDGQWPRSSDLVSPEDERQFDALQQFCDWRHTVGARGQVIVSYIREAWVTAENDNIRLTFDRHLSAETWMGNLSVRGLEDGLRPDVHGVVLELKFTDRFPTWMREMVRVFNLQRTTMAKYVACVLKLKSREQPSLLPLTEAALL